MSWSLQFECVLTVTGFVCMWSGEGGGGGGGRGGIRQSVTLLRCV